MTQPSSNESKDTYAYTVIHIPHDEAGIKKYINDYKVFRLLSLQLAPKAFASTYAREVAFNDDLWYTRLSNPGANTFIAVRESGQVISTATMLGPLPYDTDVLPPTGNPWAAIIDNSAQDEHDFFHFRINGIFTLPEARRKGISKALIQKSIDHAKNEARLAKKRNVVVSVIVDADNSKARALYRSAGFVEMMKLAAAENEYERSLVILEHKMSAFFQ